MGKKWWLPVVQAFLAALILAYAIPFGSLGGWYVLTSGLEREARESPEWPCGPFTPGIRGRVTDVLYRVYWIGISPGRDLGTRLWFPVAHNRVSYMLLGYDLDHPLEPERPAWCEEYSRWNLRNALTYFGGWITFAFWFLVFGVVEALRWGFFQQGSCRSRRRTGWWIVAATVAVVTAGVVVARTVMGLECGAWNWPLLVVAAAVCVFQVIVTRRTWKGREEEEERVTAGGVTRLHRLEIATWLLAAVNVGLWMLVTPL